MQFEVVLRGSTICTKRAAERFLSGMSTNVLSYVVFPDCGIFTEGALMQLADRSSPAFPRVTTDQSHLLGIS